MAFSQGCKAAIPSAALDSRFLQYALIASTESMKAAGSGSTFLELSTEAFASLPLPIAGLEQQRRIADFLDDRVTRIDHIITARRRQASLAAATHLERSRQMTTVGLATATRSTHIPWMPTIGSDHVLWRIGQAFSTGSGTTPKSDNTDYYDGAIPWATTSDLRDNLEVRPPRSVTSSALSDYSTLAVYPPGTLLVAMYGATVGRAGVLAVQATVNQACCALSSRRVVDPAYAFYWFVAHRPEIMTLASGGGQPNISQDVVRGLRIPAPPWSEQQKVLTELHKSARQASAATLSLSDSLVLLQEYKQSLITAAVTGELDVTTAGSGIPG